MIRSIVILLLFGHLCLAESGSVASEESISNSIDASGSVDSNEVAGRRIIGGQNAYPGQFPYVVRLAVTFNYWSWASCTATVILCTDRKIIILTAGHCLKYQGTKALFAYAMITNAANNSPIVIAFEPNEMYVHPNYSGVVNDIAILKKSTEVNYSGVFGTPPSLPNGQILSDIYINSNATVVGWGKTSDNGPGASVLQWAIVNFYPNNLCKKRFRGSAVTDKVICTLNRGKGICNGDSGGPLMIERSDVKYLVGVTSFGAGRCEAYVPSAYTYVLAYVDWIIANMS